jgi:hypothetical protein
LNASGKPRKKNASIVDVSSYKNCKARQDYL